MNPYLYAPPTGFVETELVSHILDEHHYLGALRRGLAWRSDAGVLIVANPSSRRLPSRWMELSRWCIVDRSPNAGSSMFRRFVRDFRSRFPTTTTLVSYSDPAQGHTGALYRACNWLYAPTWHAIRPPPTGNGSWTTGRPQAVKDRWVFPLRRDPDRVEILRIRDESILRRRPELTYREPGGVPYRLRPGAGVAHAIDCDLDLDCNCRHRSLSAQDRRPAP